MTGPEPGAQTEEIPGLGVAEARVIDGMVCPKNRVDKSPVSGEWLKKL